MWKTADERVRECIEARINLRRMAPDGTCDLVPFVEAMNAFVTHGEAREGILPLPEIQRDLVYRLSPREGDETVVALRHWDKRGEL